MEDDYQTVKIYMPRLYQKAVFVAGALVHNEYPDKMAMAAAIEKAIMETVAQAIRFYMGDYNAGEI